MADEPVPTPAPAPSPPAPKPAPKPGWLTSEHLLSYAAMLLSALYLGGVIPTDGVYAKIAGVAAAVLLSLGYTVSRTIVKTTIVLAVLCGVAGAPSGCSMFGAKAETMSGAFSTCAKADLGRVIHPDGGVLSTVPPATLLTFVEEIVSLNVPALEAQLGALAAIVTGDAVKCAVAAIEAVDAPTGAAALLSTPLKPSGLARARTWAAAH